MKFITTTLFSIVFAAHIVYAADTLTLLGVGSGAGAGCAFEICDDYSINTTANYTRIAGTGSLSISGGKLHQAVNFDFSVHVHNTAISSVDHYCQASIMRGALHDYTGIGARYVNTADTGYVARFANGSTDINLYRHNAGAETFLTSFALGSAAMTEYLVKVTVSGSGATVTVNVDVNGINRISYADSSASRLTTGSYAGLHLNKSSDNNDVTMDNLRCNAGT